MNIRTATPEDTERIRTIAHDSLRSLYTDFLDATTVETAIEQWYGDAFVEELAEEDMAVLVAETDGTVTGFAQSHLLGDARGTGQVSWIHVHPDHRGAGTGSRLLVRTIEHLRDAGASRIVGSVLDENTVGGEFYRRHGFEASDEREVTIGEKQYVERVFVETDQADQLGVVEAVHTDDGDRFVNYGEPVRGSTSPFYAVYEDTAATARYGWFCGNCDSVDTAMDSMGRIECNACGNRRKPTRWDAAYL